MSDDEDCDCSLHLCCMCRTGYHIGDTYVLLSPWSTAHPRCLDDWRKFYPVLLPPALSLVQEPADVDE